MKFKYNPYSAKPTTYTAAEAVEREVKDAPDYYDGELEGMRRKQERLIELVGFLFEQLPEDKAEAAAEALGYSWSVAED